MNANRQTCPECHGSGSYASPITGKVSPCSLCAAVPVESLSAILGDDAAPTPTRATPSGGIYCARCKTGHRVPVIAALCAAHDPHLAIDEDDEEEDLSEESGPWCSADFDVRNDGRLPRADLDEDEARTLAALANCLDLTGEDVADAEVSDGGVYGHGYSIEVGGSEYAVCTDGEADYAWDEALDSYLDDGCVEGADSPYFDRDAWKRDARHDGRGHCLSPYDGNEDEGTADGETFYVYRIN